MSGVRLSGDLALRNARFIKGDVVHMARLENGARIKASFRVHSLKYNSRGYVEYQLVDILTGQLYQRGAYVRQNLLKSDSQSGPTPMFSQAESSANTPKPSVDKKDEKKAKQVEYPDSRQLQTPFGSDPSQHDVRYDDIKSETLGCISSGAGVQSFVDSGYATEDKKMSASGKSVSQPESSGREISETNSVYSDQSSVPSSYRDMYIAEIAADLMEHISAEVITKEDGSLEKLYEQLPRLLKGFAIELASRSRTQESRDAMVFICKHRYAIVAQLRRLCESEAARDKSAAWTIEEKIDHWRTLVSNDFQNDEEAFVGVSDLEEVSDEIEIDAIPPYKGLIVTSHAHQWLVSRIEHELITTRLDVNGKQRIGEKILADMSGAKSLRTISRLKNPGTCEARFSISWSPFDFFKEQGFEVEYGVFLHQAIAITGQETDAQATTVEEYLRQCWPRVSEQLLDVLKASSTDVSAGRCLSVIDKTFADPMDPEKKVTALKLTYQQSGDEASVSVVGNAETIAEVGEALAWLSVALRSSGSGGLRLCRPDVVLKRREADYFAWDLEHSTTDLPLSAPEDSMPGTCWVSLFRNPILVTGFPVLKKPEEILGLEMPLNIMAALVDSTRITEFAGTIFIRGFNSVLVLTKHDKYACAWHLLVKEDGTHLSYDDPAVNLLSPVRSDVTNIHEMESARHFVGWCSSVRASTGSTEASYDIGRSMLSRPKAGFALEKASISGGKIISAGISFAFGKKDRPRITVKTTYQERLEWIAKKYIVLFDVVDRRAWLVNGISALLHLVRASLRHGETGDFKDYNMFQQENMVAEETSRVGKHAAISVLMNAHNQTLPLHKNTDESFEEMSIEQEGQSKKTGTTTKIKSTHYRLKDRVEQIFILLEQMIDYQAQVSSEDGIAFKVRKSPRERLEGYDFMDVATDENPIWPRSITLKSIGTGWVDLVREIKATILFGSGFGELLKPAGKTGNCGWWTKAPTGSDHLAVSVLDLEDIISRWGNKTGASWQLVDNVHWHCPDKLFESCRCEADSTKSHCDRVQVLLPPKIMGVFKRTLKSPAALEEQGAVIFGHSRTLPLTWDKHGGVQEGIPDELVESIPDTCGESEASSSRESDKHLSPNSTLTMSGVETSQTPPSTQASLAPVFDKRSRSPSRLQALKEKVRLH